MGDSRVDHQQLAPDQGSAPPVLGRKDDVELNATIHELFVRQARRTPDGVAVSFGRKRLSYRELDAWSSKLCTELASRGVGPETLVGIAIERSYEMVVALLGILKAGAAFVSLDPAYPEKRLGYMIDDAHVSMILTEEWVVEWLPRRSAPIFCIDTEWGRIEKQDIQPRPVMLHPDNLAYVMYTSGSTGHPKGVMITHRGVRNRLLWDHAVYGLRPGDAVLQHTSLNFDIAVWEIFTPLTAGARLVLAKPDAHQDPAYIVRLVREEELTTIALVPSVLEALLDIGGLATCERLRYVFSGGEALPTALQDRFFDDVPQATLHNFYGPSEASIDVTAWACRPDTTPGIVPIGRPIAGVQAYVLNGESLEVASKGTDGELFVGGVGLARGYLRRPGLTAGRFLPNPFTAEPGARMYRTGDLVRTTDGDVFEFLGRVDHQVKVRGFRIELEEIEAALVHHEAVRQAVVVATDGPSAAKQLYAYVVPERDKMPTAEELRSAIAADLPDYMIPRLFTVLDKLPLTPTGKVDRAALPKPDQHEQRSVLASAHTPREEMIARIFAQLTGHQRVGVDESFFELGGTSLQVARLAALVGDALGIDVDLRFIFEHPTAEALARLPLARAAEA